MASYKVSFFKNLLSSDGHPFKCLQRAIDIRRAKSVDRAVQAAERRFERFHRVPDWKLHADTLEVEADGKKVECPSLQAEPRRAKYPNIIYGMHH